MATNRNPSEMPRRAARHDDYTCNGLGHRTYRHGPGKGASLRRHTLPLQASERNVTRDLCDVLIARLGNRCFRGNRCHRSTSKDQQGWILKLSLPESKLNWKLPEDIFPWALRIAGAFDPNGIQSRELCVCPSAKTLCVLPPSPRIGLVDKSPTLCYEGLSGLRTPASLGRKENHEASLPLVIRHRSGHFAPKESG